MKSRRSGYGFNRALENASLAWLFSGSNGIAKPLAHRATRT